MPLPSHTPWLDLEQVGDITVVRLTLHDLPEERLVETLGDQLFQLIELGHYQILLHLGKVEQVNSSILARIVGLHKRAKAAGGRLALCQVDPAIQKTIRLLKLHRFLSIYDREEEALKSFA